MYTVGSGFGPTSGQAEVVGFLWSNFIISSGQGGLNDLSENLPPARGLGNIYRSTAVFKLPLFGFWANLAQIHNSPKAGALGYYLLQYCSVWGGGFNGALL
jgi:hypothetical protein